MSINAMLPTRTDRPAYGDKVRATVAISNSCVAAGAVGTVMLSAFRGDIVERQWAAFVQFPGVRGLINISDADVGVEWLSDEAGNRSRRI